MLPYKAAFPSPDTGAEGMSKREFGAFLILAGMVGDPAWLNKTAVKVAVELSELLLKELNEPTPDRDRTTPERK